MQHWQTKGSIVYVKDWRNKAGHWSLTAGITGTCSLLSHTSTPLPKTLAPIARARTSEQLSPFHHKHLLALRKYHSEASQNYTRCTIITH